jgi:hypothetical protein
MSEVIMNHLHFIISIYYQYIIIYIFELYGILNGIQIKIKFHDY